MEVYNKHFEPSLTPLLVSIEHVPLIVIWNGAWSVHIEQSVLMLMCLQIRNYVRTVNAGKTDFPNVLKY